MTVYTSLPISKVVSDYQAGDSLLILAGKHGVSKGTIRRALESANVPTRSSGYHSGAARAAPVRKIDPKRVHRMSTPPADPLSLEEIERLRRVIGWTIDWTAPYDPVRGD